MGTLTVDRVHDRQRAPSMQQYQRSQRKWGDLTSPHRGIQLAAFSVCGGFPIFVDYLTFANIGQVIALALLAPAAKLLSKADVVRLISISLSVAISPMYLGFVAQADPKWLQIGFFILAVWQIGIVIRFAPYVSDPRRLLRTPINLAAVVILGVALNQYILLERPLLNLYFQDKSHAAVTVYGLAFLTMWANRGPLRFILALALYAVSMGTASRLVALGAPMLLIAALVEYRRSRRSVETLLGIYLHHVVLITMPLGIAWVATSGIAASLTDRLSRVREEASTAAHLELINMAWQLKVSDPFVALLGTGPGGFAFGLAHADISLARLAMLDPAATLGALEGFVPIHSVPVSVGVEFPVWIALAFFALWVKILRRTWSGSSLTMTWFGLGLLTVTVFYSSHNEYFYTVFLSLLCLVAFRGQVEPVPASPTRGDHPIQAFRAISRREVVVDR